MVSDLIELPKTEDERTLQKEEDEIYIAWKNIVSSLFSLERIDQMKLNMMNGK